MLYLAFNFRSYTTQNCIETDLEYLYSLAGIKFTDWCTSYIGCEVIRFNKFGYKADSKIIKACAELKKHRGGSIEVTGFVDIENSEHLQKMVYELTSYKVTPAESLSFFICDLKFGPTGDVLYTMPKKIKDARTIFWFYEFYVSCCEDIKKEKLPSERHAEKPKISTGLLKKVATISSFDIQDDLVKHLLKGNSFPVFLLDTKDFVNMHLSGQKLILKKLLDGSPHIPTSEFLKVVSNFGSYAIRDLLLENYMDGNFELE